MSDRFHVYADLMCSSGFKLALYQCYITESLQYFIMCHRFFAYFSIGISVKHFTKTLMTTDMSTHRSFVYYPITPNQGHIDPVDGIIKKLLCQTGYRFFGFGKDHESTGVFIDPMH